VAKEIRITFKEKEKELYDYIQEKSSASAFLKNLAAIEKKREEIYIYGLSKNVESNNKINKSEYEIDISDLDQ